MDARILIVDDSKAVVQALTSILSDQGYQVESRSDGKSGWERIMAGAERRALMPDLLLLDLNMPGMDGLTLLRRMRADERFALLPVVILTVQADPSIRLTALEAGANDYLAKPVQTLELLARVKALLGWKLAERSQQRRMEHLVEAGRMLLSTLDLDSVLQRVMQIVIEELGAENASIWLVGSDESLECRAAFGDVAERLLGVRMEPGQSIAGWALQYKQSVLTPDAQADPRFYRKLDELLGFHTRDLVAAPLLVRESGIGVLEAVNKKQEPFSPADLAWMEVLAPLAAAAIANARLFQALRRRTVQLQAHNEELDAFAHTVAHDLKTPVASIVGFAEALEEAHARLSGGELRRYLRVMARNGRKMSHIIDALLLLAGVRKLEVEMKPLDMGSIVAEAMQRLSGMIKERQAEVIVPETWPVALGYGPWVEEVWINYLSNALKYGGRPPRVELGASPPFASPPAGGTEGGRGMERAPTPSPSPNSGRGGQESSPPGLGGTEGGYVRFWVRDNGPGLTPEAQDKLFIPFTRLDRVRAEGYGLGLSIVQRIMEKLGGQVGVESTVGQGSVFSFTLRSAAGKATGVSEEMQQSRGGTISRERK